MIFKPFIALAVALTLATSIPSMAQSAMKVVVHQLDAADYEHALATIGKFTLTGESLVIVTTADENIEVCPIASLRSISFTQGKTAIAETLRSDVAVSMGPNPTSGTVSISGVDDGTAVRVFDLQGKVVLRGAAPVVDLTPLHRGVYLLQVGAQVVKVVRK